MENKARPLAIRRVFSDPSAEEPALPELIAVSET